MLRGEGRVGSQLVKTLGCSLCSVKIRHSGARNPRFCRVYWVWSGGGLRGFELGPELCWVLTVGYERA